MEGFIFQLSKDIGSLDEAIEDLNQHGDAANDPFIACQCDRLVLAKDLVVKVRDALKESLLDS